MTKYDAPQETLDGLGTVQDHLKEARQIIAQLALRLHREDFPYMAASLTIIHDDIVGSMMAVSEHMGRYTPAQVPEIDLYDLPEDHNSLLRAFDDMDVLDPSKAPTRSPELAELHRQQLGRRHR